MGWIEEYGRPTAKKVAEVFGGTPKFSRHLDEPETHSIDILSSVDPSHDDLVRYSTLGLQQYPNVIRGADIRVELCGVAEKRWPQFQDIIATIAFYVMKDGWKAEPGITYESMIGMYNLSVNMKHIVFTEPFEWEELATVHLTSDVVVHWLLVVPLSDSELSFRLEHGWDRLEELFMQNEIDYWDLNRPSVV